MSETVKHRLHFPAIKRTAFSESIQHEQTPADTMVLALLLVPFNLASASFSEEIEAASVLWL